MRLFIALASALYVTGAAVKLESEKVYLAFTDKNGKEESIIDNTTIPALISRIGALETGMKLWKENMNERFSTLEEVVSNFTKTIEPTGNIT